MRNVSEIKVGGNDDQAIVPGVLRDLLIGGYAQADVAYVRGLMSGPSDQVGGTARQTGVYEKMHCSDADALDFALRWFFRWNECQACKFFIGESNCGPNVIVGQVVFAPNGLERITAGQMSQNRRDWRAGAANDRL